MTNRTRVAALTLLLSHGLMLGAQPATSPSVGAPAQVEAWVRQLQIDDEVVRTEVLKAIGVYLRGTKPPGLLGGGVLRHAA